MACDFTVLRGTAALSFCDIDSLRPILFEPYQRVCTAQWAIIPELVLDFGVNEQVTADGYHGTLRAANGQEIFLDARLSANQARPMRWLRAVTFINPIVLTRITAYHLLLHNLAKSIFVNLSTLGCCSFTPHSGTHTMQSIRMEYDDLAYERSEELFELWKKKAFSGTTRHDIAGLAQKHRRGPAVELHKPDCGSCNVVWRLEFADGGSAIIRFAVGGEVMFPEEKVRTEVAAMRFIADNTSIPVPFVLHMGMTSESVGGLGPFIVMDYVKHDHDLGSALNIPGRGIDDVPLLDPNIAEAKLELIYGQMAETLLQLSLPSLPLIGSFSETNEYEWAVTERPMTFNYNLLVQLGDIAPDRLPMHTFRTASSYYSSMADMHLEHLSAQHNDAILSEDDCCHKYVARQLFRKLAVDGRLDTFPEFEKGPFKLYCDDLRPNNFLATENHTVVGIVDWEFTFSAPAGFAFSPPWWLLLQRPERWPWGLDKWEEKFTLRLKTWIKALKAKERAALERGTLRPDQILSDRMQRSWDNGAFWINYAAQNSWAFDTIYFNRLDKKFFGKVDEKDWLAARLPLLTEAQRWEMEPFVQRKMAQKANPRLVDSRFDAFV